MFAIAFDLTVAKVKMHHPKGVSQAYRDLGRELRAKDFERTQGSVYLTERRDLANLFAAIRSLEALTWFPNCVRDIRGFRVEECSDFTPMVTERVRGTTMETDPQMRKARKKSSGFAEDPASYLSGPISELVGQVRRFGEEGPAYEVVELLEEGEALIEVVYSQERLAVPVGDILADPIAETIP